MHFSSVLATAAFASSASAGYTLAKDYTSNFFDNFDFFTSPDPTHGFVNYVDSGTAFSNGLASTSNGIYIGVDHQNNAPSGRNSVRLTSKDSYNQALIILDLAHMPGSIPGIWPAFWTVGPNWPNNGEVDIIEGVGDQTVDYMTLHLGNPQCLMESVGAASLPITFADCYAERNGNEGCTFHDTDSTSYGSGFNNNGGGIFAMQNTGSTISIWKFSHSDAAAANALSSNPDPSTWGSPRSSWLSTSTCDLNKEVNTQSIVFDTTFCGDWAGNVYPGGPSACQSFVANNPGAFKDAYWQVNSLKVYAPNGQVSSPASSSSAPTPVASTTSSVPVAATSILTEPTGSDSPPPPAQQTTTSAAPAATSILTEPIGSDPPPPPAQPTTPSQAPVPTTTPPAAPTTTPPPPAQTTAAGQNCGWDIVEYADGTTHEVWECLKKREINPMRLHGRHFRAHEH